MALRTGGALMLRWNSLAHPYMVIQVQVTEEKEFSFRERWLRLEEGW